MLRLKELRMRKGVTQLEFSKDMGVAASTVGMWEQGRNEPDAETLKSIARYFNVSTDYLLGYNSPVRTEPATAKPFTDDEVELIKLYRFTDEWGREQIMSLAESNAKRIAFTQKKRLEVAM